MEPRTLVVLEGDQTGQELLEESLRVLAPQVIGVPLTLQRYDLSLGRRRATKNAVVHEAGKALLAAGLGGASRPLGKPIEQPAADPAAVDQVHEQVVHSAEVPCRLEDGAFHGRDSDLPLGPRRMRPACQPLVVPRRVAWPRAATEHNEEES